MAIFAEITNSAVTNIAVAASSANLPAGMWVPVDTISPQPGIGWAYDGKTFTAPTPPVPTSAQQGASALAAFLSAGLTVTSTGTPALNGVYSIAPGAQQSIASEAQFVSTFNEFTNGATTNMPWVLQNGLIVEWPTTTAFVAFAKIAAQTVSAAQIAAGKIAAGQSVPMPSNAVTIP